MSHKFPKEDFLSSSTWVPLSITYVEYPKDDIIGKYLAIISLLPLAISVGFVALALFRRDLHTITFGFGLIVNDVTNTLLKNLIAESRPMSRNVEYSEFGNPSSHSQFMAFFAFYSVLFIIFRLRHSRSHVEILWKFFLVVALAVSAAGVMYSRIYLNYHTYNQVFNGIFAGVLFSMFWFLLTQFAFTPLYPIVCSWRVSEYFLLRDMTPIPNILWFEYTHARVEARTRSRNKLRMKNK